MQRKKILETQYNRQGITLQRVRHDLGILANIASNKYKESKSLNRLVLERCFDFKIFSIEKIKQIKKDYINDGFSDFESFFLISSDPLLDLIEYDIKCGKIATVAGNGDFGQIFIAKGCRYLNIFDISLPAIFYSELKLISLEQLKLEEYLKFLGKGMERLTAQLSCKLPFLDYSYWRYVSSYLSPQAVMFFETLCGDEKYKSIIRNDSWADFVRPGNSLVYIGDIINNESEYYGLQDKMKEVSIEFNLGDIFNLYDRQEIGNFDLVYLSNIGIEIAETIKLIERLFFSGAKRIIFTFFYNDHSIKEVERLRNKYAIELLSNKDDFVGIREKKNFLAVASRL